MANLVTKGKALVGTLRGRRGGYGQFSLVGSIARTNTSGSAAVLGVLPQDAQMIGVTVYGGTGSNAGTTAAVSVGLASGTGHEILNGDSVLGAAGLGQYTPSGATLLGKQTADQTITGFYAETGTASTTGGPWTVVVEFVV